jgi:hypothetical protein
MRLVGRLPIERQAPSITGKRPTILDNSRRLPA